MGGYLVARQYAQSQCSGKFERAATYSRGWRAGAVKCANFAPAMCGVVGIFGHPEAANLAYLGLYALQHRGQESAGIVSTDGDRLRWVREMGHVGDIFTADRLGHLGGFAAIGHVR